MSYECYVLVAKKSYLPASVQYPVYIRSSYGAMTIFKTKATRSLQKQTSRPESLWVRRVNKENFNRYPVARKCF